MLKLEPLLSAEVTLAPAQEFGATPQGRRRIIAITGGTFSGARLHGRVLPGGADWQVIREDGVAVLDTRYTLETHDGAVVFTSYRGRIDLAKGGVVYAAPLYDTGDDRYRWLNAIQAIAKGTTDGTNLEYEIYEVR